MGPPPRVLSSPAVGAGAAGSSGERTEMWESWIQAYGPIAIFIGCIVEGETFLILAGYSVSRGYLEPGSTLLLAIAGATLGDSLYYWIGRRWGLRILKALPSTRPVRARATLLLRRWGRSVAFATRFAYGLRFVLPLMIGASRFPALTFHLVNLLAAVAFAGFYLTIGFLFGEAVEQMLDRVRPYETRIILLLITLSMVFWAVREWRLYRAIPPEVEEVMADQDAETG
jgi:membrane protein DedA with SNARE-associated domain